MGQRQVFREKKKLEEIRRSANIGERRKREKEAGADRLNKENETQEKNKKDLERKRDRHRDAKRNEKGEKQIGRHIVR